MITLGTEFNFDSHRWTVLDIDKVSYVNYHGHVVKVLANNTSVGGNRYINLYANGTPLGYYEVNNNV